MESIRRKLLRAPSTPTQLPASMPAYTLFLCLFKGRACCCQGPAPHSILLLQLLLIPAMQPPLSSIISLSLVDPPLKNHLLRKKKRFLLHAFSFYSPFLSQTHLIRLLPSPLHQSCSCHFFITMPMVLSPYSAC